MKIKLNNLIPIKLKGKDKEIFISSISSLLIKGSGFIISFLSMPLYITYFNDQVVLGMWFTLLSMLSWIFTFDLGLGNGLRNKLVEVLNKGMHVKAKQYISSTYIVLGITSVIVGIISIIIFPLMDWNRVLNVDSSVISVNVLLISVFILFFGVLINFFLKLINSILYALQKSAINNLLALISSILQLVYIFFAKSASMEENLLKLSIVYIITVNLPLLVATIVVFMTNLKNCKPSFKYSNLRVAKSMLKFGGMFFLVQIVFMIITSTNEIIITNIFGPEQVVDYQVYFRIFMLAGSLFALALTPVWSAVTKAIAEKDFKWLIKLNRTLFKVTLIAIVGEMLIVPFMQIIINVWLGDSTIQIKYGYATIFALFGSTYIMNISLTTIANGAGYLKTQLYCYSIGAIFKLPVIYLLKELYDSWIIVVVVNTFILLFFSIVQIIWLKGYILKNAYTE